jgi:hypothetical protein
MKNFSLLLILLQLSILSVDLQAQTESHQRVERYLYTFYNSNKSSIRETERLMQFLEERMDLYLITLDKDQMKLIKSDDKEVEAYVKQLEGIRSLRVVRQTVEEGRSSYRETLDRLINDGLKSRADVLNCRKILVLKSMELNMLNNKQNKLLALLKDDYVRQEFIQTLITKKSQDKIQDLRALTQEVDLAIDTYDI